MTGNWTRLLCAALAVVCAYGESKSCPNPNNSNTLLRDDILQCSQGFHVKEIGMIDEYKNSVTLSSEHIPLTTATCESNGWTIDGFFLSGVQLTSFICVPTPGLDSTTTTTTTTTAAPTTTTTVPTTTTTYMRPPPPIVPPPFVYVSDANKNCEIWATSTGPKGRFCTHARYNFNGAMLYSPKPFCEKTCAFEINPNADCALYTKTSALQSLERRSYNRFALPPYTTGLSYDQLLWLVYVRPGCKVTLYSDAAGTSSIGSPIVGASNSDEIVFILEGSQQSAQSFSCLC